MRYAFLIAYDGSPYFGFVRQPDKPTVEGELLKAFKEHGLYLELKNARYQVAARTDRGVSAIGQVVALNTCKRPSLREMRKILPENIAVLAIAKVGPDFNPRKHALSKYYRYVCQAQPNFCLRLAQQAAKLFVGRRDFTYFCKHEKGRPNVGEIERVDVHGGETLIFDFVGETFLWQQVRRMVNALVAVGTRKLSLEELEQMLENRARQAMQPALADGLILVGIQYPSPILKPNKCITSKFIRYLKANKSLRNDEMVCLLQKQLR